MFLARLFAQLLVAVVLGASCGAGSASAAFPGTNGRIAFDSARSGNGDVFVMNAHGSSPVDLTNDPVIDFQAAFSPDGSKIAFTRGTTGEVFAMNADGSGQVNL